MKKVLSVLLVLLTVLGGGGLILATQADASMPGDALYSVDLLVEEIERKLTVDDVKRVELETRILTERVSELESISETTDDLEDILGAVSEQQKRVQEHLGTLEGDPARQATEALEQVRNRYEKQLQKHIEVMEQVQNKGGDTAIQVKQQLVTNLEECGRGTCGSTTPTGNNQNDQDNGNSPTEPGQEAGSGNSETRGNPNN
jgi:hypothetical protein